MDVAILVYFDKSSTCRGEKITKRSFASLITGQNKNVNLFCENIGAKEI